MSEIKQTPWPWELDREKAEARARLIAAAPDLLDALKAVVSLKGWDEREPVSITGRQALAAIAKAEGRTNGKA